MWTREIFGNDSYHVIQWFLIYSVMGWIVESIYMSICNHRPTNRGFVKGPMCPIYGFGALGVYFLLRPFDGNYLLLYILGAVVATCFEYAVAHLMLRIFGEVWWDYSEKPFNYQGVICMESTVAWGFYTIFMFMFLQRFVEWFSNLYSYETGIICGNLVIIAFSIDLFHSLYQAKKNPIIVRVDEIRETIRNFIS